MTRESVDRLLAAKGDPVLTDEEWTLCEMHADRVSAPRLGSPVAAATWVLAMRNLEASA